MSNDSVRATPSKTPTKAATACSSSEAPRRALAILLDTKESRMSLHGVGGDATAWALIAPSFDASIDRCCDVLLVQRESPVVEVELLGIGRPAAGA
jgi:hypothetical protein